MGVRSLKYMAFSGATEDNNGFSSSDDERDEEVDTTPFSITWLDLSEYGFSEPLGLSGLPGCRFQETWRSLTADIRTLKNDGIEDVFVFCTRGELKKFRVPRLFDSYSEAGINLHHYPIQDGNVPTTQNCMKMLDELRVNLSRGDKTLIHCFGGLGRTCLIAACLLLMLDDSLLPEQAIERMRQLQGPRAIQTVKKDEGNIRSRVRCGKQEISLQMKASVKSTVYTCLIHCIRHHLKKLSQATKHVNWQVFCSGFLEISRTGLPPPGTLLYPRHISVWRLSFVPASWRLSRSSFSRNTAVSQPHLC
ncbi:putative cyclin-dependent kinase inhibitor 3 [Apostichopus japonicus]|uniref:protein-tyrosine-phosphatase n=1 Tax=Stichopus japonicus TaxID=307972 RepID=A0A2G8L5I1_STIJA|nr:putative cyclin-dependent kinase inhibitor 3 [Apostichopus japonicus]